MKKNLLSSLLLAGLMTIGLTGCGDSGSSSTAGTPSNPTSSQVGEPSSSVISTGESSPIKELTAVNENAEIVIGETASTAGFYNLVGYKSLNAKNKKVVVTSADETIIKVASNYKTMTAVGIGTTAITVVSEVDATKTCTFNVTVNDSFFDRTVSSMDARWDVEHEMDAENPYIKVDSNAADGLYIRNSDGLKWYAETSITIHSVLSGEEWPKFGIVANTTVNTTEVNNNKVYFFIDAPMHSDGSWTNFGVCEVSNGVNWAWNAGVGNSVARHNDCIYQVETPIGYETKFTMGMIRDGFNCHFYVNGVYAGSANILGSILGNYDAATQDYTSAANAMAGFFSFNSVNTFSNYRFVNDATVIDEMITAIGEPTYCTWYDD